MNQDHRHVEDLLIWENIIKEMEFLLLADLNNVAYEQFFLELLKKSHLYF